MFAVSGQVNTYYADGSGAVTVGAGGTAYAVLTASTPGTAVLKESGIFPVTDRQLVRPYINVFPVADGASGSIYIGAVWMEDASTIGDYIPDELGVWLDPRTGILGTAHASPSVERAQFWVEEATTNLLPNPGAENAAVFGASGVNAAVVTKDSTRAYMGASSFKVVTPGAIGNEGIQINTSSGLGFTGAASPFIGSFWHFGAGSFQTWTRIVYADASVLDTAITPYTGTNGWQRIVTPVATVDPAKTVSTIYLMGRTLSATPQALTFYVDCAQIEQKSYLTSYCDGSLGTGYTWAGTAHASASSRAGAGVTMPVSSRVSTVAGAAMIRAWASGGTPAANKLMVVGQWGLNPGDAIDLGWTPSLGRLSGYWTTNGSSGGGQRLTASGTFPVATWKTAYAGWTATDNYLATNNDALAAFARTLAPYGNTGAVVTLYVGALAGGVQALDGYIGPVITYESPLSDARRALVNTAIDSNGATDLWTLFEEWEAIGSPADLLALQSGQATAGVKAEGQPVNLLALQSGDASYDWHPAGLSGVFSLTPSLSGVLTVGVDMGTAFETNTVAMWLTNLLHDIVGDVTEFAAVTYTVYRADGSTHDSGDLTFFAGRGWNASVDVPALGPGVTERMRIVVRAETPGAVRDFREYVDVSDIAA